MSKKSKNYEGLIPFDIWGNQLHYPSEWPRAIKPENLLEDGRIQIEDRDKKIKILPWTSEQLGLKLFDASQTFRYVENCIGSIQGLVKIPNYQFCDSLEYDGYSRGRSAAYFNFKSKKDGRGYTFFLTDFEDIIKEMEQGVVSGVFTFCKRGANFGCKLIK